MKILILTNNFPNQNHYGNTFVKSLVDRIAKVYDKVYVISAVPYFPRWAKVFLNNSNKPSYDFKNYCYENVEVYYPKFFTLPLESFRKKSGDNAAKSVIKCITQNNIEYDIIHSHFAWISGYIGMKLKEKSGKRHVLTAHGFDVYLLPFKNEFWKNQMRKVYGSADSLITVSNSNAEKLKELGYDSKVIPNAFSEKFEEPKKIILNIGNLVKIKNQINLINAANILKDKRTDFLIYVIGGGPEYKRLDKRINELRLNEYVKLTGPKANDEVAALLNKSDLLVISSYSESFGVTAIESLACGVPVVATINGGSEELILQNENGLLIKNPEDYEAMAKAIDTALNINWDKLKIKMYSHRFNAKVVVKEILKEYGGVL